MRNILISTVFILIITLIAAALNISNDSINQLTGEERLAVIAINLDDRNINLQLLGEEYQFSQPVEKSSQLFEHCSSSIRNFLLNIWIILTPLLFNNDLINK